jgi:hypothetical protein
MGVGWGHKERETVFTFVYRGNVLNILLGNQLVRKVGIYMKAS